MDPTGAPVFSPRKEATTMLKIIVLSAIALVILMIATVVETFHGR